MNHESQRPSKHKVGQAPYALEFTPELEIDINEVDLSWTDALEALSPFGIGNPQPLFFARAVPVVGVRVLKDVHLKLQLGSRSLDAIGFGLGHHAEGLSSHIDILFTIERNTFRVKQTSNWNSKPYGLTPTLKPRHNSFRGLPDIGYETSTAIALNAI